jgi:hypothetical protein
MHAMHSRVSYTACDDGPIRLKHKAHFIHQINQVGFYYFIIMYGLNISLLDEHVLLIKMFSMYLTANLFRAFKIHLITSYIMYKEFSVNEPVMIARKCGAAVNTLQAGDTVADFEVIIWPAFYKLN